MRVIELARDGVAALAERLRVERAKG